MKGIFLSFLLLGVGLLNLAGETVMIFVQNAEGSDYITEERLENASAVETGIMDMLFDEGHIAFNAGVRLDQEPAADELMKRLTRIAGAKYLFAVGIGAPDADTAIPLFIEYAFINTLEDEIVADGFLRSEDLDVTSMSSFEVCGAFGSLAAAAVLEGLK
ncbi:MAG: hypothetical protein HN368_15165 [Spirochaetales bacterium]|jgi:hypothetical protein|nr:hypothetical protein [Spirochaetales bacterium]